MLKIMRHYFNIYFVILISFFKTMRERKDRLLMQLVQFNQRPELQRLENQKPEIHR